MIFLGRGLNENHKKPGLLVSFSIILLIIIQLRTIFASMIL